MDLRLKQTLVLIVLFVLIAVASFAVARLERIQDRKAKQK